MALANVVLTNTFDDWRTRTNQILVQGEQTFGVANGAFNKVNVVNVYATSIALSTNSYATAVGAAGNAYATAIGAAGNSRAAAIGTSGNVYATAIGTSGNAYAIAVGAAGNAYALATATAIGAAANSYMIAVQNGSNTAVGTGANAYALATATSIGAAANTNASNSSYVSAGTLKMAYGGTSASLSPSAGAVAYSTSGAFAFTAVGTSGQLLQSGATGAPSWISPASLTVSRSSTTGTADNSNLLGGLAGQYSASASSVAFRDGAADLTARLFRAEYQNESSMSGAIAFRNASGAGADNYTRYCSNPAAVRAWVGSGYTLLGGIATNTGATTVGFNADLSTYTRLFVTAVNVSHNRAGTTGSYFKIYSPTNGVSTTCSGAYTGSGLWLGYVDLDLYSGVGIYADDGATVAANFFAIFQYTGGIYFNVSSGHGFDSGAIYVFGAR